MMPGKTRRKKGGRRFIRLWTNVQRSEAYHDLDCHARAGLIEILGRYNGINNGMIVFGVRDMAAALCCSQGKASRVFIDLDDANLIKPNRVGAYRGRRATEWRLTFMADDTTDRELPIHDWTPWRKADLRSPAKAQSAFKVHRRKRKQPERSPAKAQKPKSSMNGSAERSRSDTHIDIYQEGSGNKGAASDGRTTR